MGRVGIIDIGSNSVRYMEAECTLEHVHSLFKSVHTTRLAEGQGSDRMLQDGPMRRTAETVNTLAVKAAEKGIPVYAYATSAVREADNRDRFLSMIHKALPVSVLSGDEEGRLAYDGATGGKGTMIDIGGGSMQVVTEKESFSAPVGCVRFRDLIPDGTPEELFREASEWLKPYFDGMPQASSLVTGVGGTITTIGALQLGQRQYDGGELGKTVITPDSLETLLDRLYAMGNERKEHPLLINRHDVILQGGTLLRCLMKRLGIMAVIPCDRDGMEGFALSIFAKR